MGKVASVKIKSNKEEVTEELQKKIYAWLEAVGEDAASTAASVAPVDTGRLKSSISSAVVESEQAAYIGTNVEYAPYQEFGTSRGIPAKHFLQFGITAHSDEYADMLERALSE